ncbi:tetraketide alpha-pyrone reductase 1 [Dendrobium catenatum]|uniref:Tetraketide alpha-pyrone reductase 1 n=1 Tax=Dendrobium catenatum TaxID=906689 RepID=A0A2I0XI55_9ASPA|nr:tetraketide alpha-pyrone reductase 1 [Dendrobium catenatum]PKU87591.1 Tetraketide alpha-pyrone reductase 1 [Dendrobium catenatum]
MDESSHIKGKVCVTGASGFLASWLIKQLPKSGYHVIGTVRDPENYRKLSHLWELEGAKERLQLVKANLLEEGSFDEAVLGCQGVFHTASPVFGPQHGSQSEIMDSAVNGTLNVLRSCKRNPSLRRVVLTSSSSAVRVKEKIDPNYPLDESSWSSVELCERLKLWYALAKILAERIAWEFAKENDIDLVTVLPSFIIGPNLPNDLSLTASNVLGFLRGETKEFSLYGRMGYVHIDDVARCHIIVYEDLAAKGRYICSSVVLDNNELGALVAKRYPWLPIPTRFDDYYDGKITQYTFNTSKLHNMGFKFKGIEEMFDDYIQSLKDKGSDI